MVISEFETIAGEEWDKVPAQYKDRIKNVALIIEDEPSEELKKEEGLGEHETLLGIYHGVPNTARGENYGVGGTLPDSITLFRIPLLEEAEMLREKDEGEQKEFAAYVRDAVRETLWHELGHYFGLDDDALHGREHDGSNHFS
jgi:predicted Zn-dependent protease with MMP-like domain